MLQGTCLLTEITIQNVDHFYLTDYSVNDEKCDCLVFGAFYLTMVNVKSDEDLHATLDLI